MKVKIAEDEWYPVLTLWLPHELRWGNVIEIPEELWAEYKKTKEEFDETQDKLAAYLTSPSA